MFVQPTSLWRPVLFALSLFAFAHDRLMLDVRTPIGKYQGGGFGPTVQLDEGTLVSSYSYRGEDDQTHLEGVRWTLPALTAVDDVRADSREMMRTAAIGQTLVVEAREQPRSDAPASIALTIEPEELRSVRLVEITSDQERPIPSQLEPGTAPRLWWIVRGELSAGAQRKYRLDTGAAVASPEVTVDRREESVTVRVGESSVLQYNSAHVDPLRLLQYRSSKIVTLALQSLSSDRKSTIIHSVSTGLFTAIPGRFIT